MGRSAAIDFDPGARDAVLPLVARLLGIAQDGAANR